MKKIVVLKYAFLATALSIGIVAGARSAAAWLAQAPEWVIGAVPRSVRLDAIDYFRNGLSRDVMTDQDVAVRVVQISELTATLQRDSLTTIQLAVLPTGRDTVLAVVTTVATAEPVSGIKFYDSQWQPLQKAPFVMPRFSSWLTAEVDADIAQARLGYVSSTARFSTDADSLIVTNTSLDKAALNGLADAMIPSQTFIIKKGRFSPAK